MNRRVAVYPGSFDPVHEGHLDIIERCRPLFDEVVVAVLHNEEKRPLFSVAERMAMIRELVADRPEIRVESFSGLLVDFMEQQRARAIVRGLRAVSDFEYEFQLAGMNRNLYPEMETIFLTPSEQHMFISATLVREIAMLGGDVTEFVHPAVGKALKKKASAGK